MYRDLETSDFMSRVKPGTKSKATNEGKAVVHVRSKKAKKKLLETARQQQSEKKPVGDGYAEAEEDAA